MSADPSSTPDARAVAAELFEHALADYDRGDLLGAIDKLREAQRAAPHPSALYNLAQFLEAAGKRAEAYRSFQEYLLVAANVGDDARRRAVERKIAELNAILAHVTIIVEPAEAVLQLNGQSVSVGEPLLLEPGAYLLSASAERHQAVQIKLQAGAGPTQLALHLRPEAAAIPPVAARQPPARSAPAGPSPQQALAPRSKTLALILFGSSAAFLSGAVVAHSLNARRSADWESENHALDAVVPAARGDAYWRARADNAALARSIRHIDGLELGLLVGASALAATGTLVWFTNDPERGGTAFGAGYSGRW